MYIQRTLTSWRIILNTIVNPVKCNEKRIFGMERLLWTQLCLRSYTYHNICCSNVGITVTRNSSRSPVERLKQQLGAYCHSQLSGQDSRLQVNDSFIHRAVRNCMHRSCRCGSWDFNLTDVHIKSRSNPTCILLCASATMTYHGILDLYASCCCHGPHSISCTWLTRLHIISDWYTLTLSISKEYMHRSACLGLS